MLRKKCKPVKEITPNLLTLLDDMADTMYEANGVGLAAPQVGILKRVVVIDIGEGLVELINPVILETSGSQIDDEGCLSVPGKYAPVERPNYAKVEAMDRDGNTFIIEGEELMARALCHEIDHLDGILYIDKALPVEEA
ncbi:MAG: peptide deformylase [Anaerotignum sp.]